MRLEFINRKQRAEDKTRMVHETGKYDSTRGAKIGKEPRRNEANAFVLLRVGRNLSAEGCEGERPGVLSFNSRPSYGVS